MLDGSVPVEVPNTVLPPIETKVSTPDVLPTLKPDSEMRAQMGLPPAEGKPVEKPLPTAAETAEMHNLLQTIQENQRENAPTPAVVEEPTEPTKPVDDVGDKKANILSRVFGGAKAAVVAAVVFVLTKLKTLLNFGIDDPHAQGA